MVRLQIRTGELLEPYLDRATEHARAQTTPVALEFEGVEFVVTPEMSVLDAAAACGHAQRAHDLSRTAATTPELPDGEWT